MPRYAPAAVATLLVAGCTGGTSPTGSTDGPTTAVTTSTSASEPTAPSPVVPARASLTCSEPIDGGPVPAGWQVVLGVVALLASPASPALQASDNGDPTEPAFFAKTGLLVRAGRRLELEVPDSPANRLGIGWGNVLTFRPSVRFAVPACPDTLHTGWVSYPGGYWADRPLCLPVTVRAGGRDQQVRIGIGTPCPGQQPPQ